MVKKILESIGFTLVVGFLGWIATGLSLLFFWDHVFITPLIVSFIGCLIIFVNALIFGLFKRRSKGMKISVFIAFFAVMFGGYLAYQAYMDSLEMPDAEVDLSEYQPFDRGTPAAAVD